MRKPVAVIVGGSSGIGLATARRLAADARVHVVGRSKARLDSTCGDNGGLIPHQADAGDRAQMEAVLDAVAQVDWLVITVSGGEGAGLITELDLGAVRRAFEAKFWPYLTTVQAAVPHLAVTGSLTLIGAVTARTGMAGTAGLAAVNGAVEALVKPLAVELAPIRVNGVSPGFVDTPWWDGLPTEARNQYFERAAEALPARHIATADEVAQAVVLAATNPNLTGTVIEVDAGARLVTVA